MNVLLLARFFSPSAGGSELLFCLIAEILAQNGHKVWIISNKIEGFDYPRHENIKTVFVSTKTFESVKNWKQKDKLHYNIATIKAGLKIIKKEKIDIIHSNPPDPVLAGSILSLLTSKKHIITIHALTTLKKDFLKYWIKQKGNSNLKAKLGQFGLKSMYKLKHSAIHTVSEASKEDLIKFGIKKPIYVIHNAIHIKNEENENNIPFQIIYVGRLVFYKNIQVVIKSLKIVKKTFPQVTLLIIGDGTYKPELVELVKQIELQDNVVFKGHVSDDEKNKLISSSQALVFPSLFEGFGLVILEAFMQKKPVLVSDVRPLSDIVEHEKTGLVIPAHDEKEWAKAIERILDEQENASKMGITGRIVLEEKYTLEKMNDSILKMYAEIKN